MSSVDDLVAWLKTQLDEDELWAKAASAPPHWRDQPPVEGGVHWTWAVGENWEPVQVDPLTEYVGEDVEDGAPALVTVEGWTTSYDRRPLAHKVLDPDEVRTVDAGHIVRHDPARVLREVEAKRAILAGHPFEQGTVGGCCGTCHGAGRIEVYWDGEEETVEHVDTEMVWPCPTVRNLTAAYIDREGFREEWRPWRP